MRKLIGEAAVGTLASLPCCLFCTVIPSPAAQAIAASRGRTPSVAGGYPLAPGAPPLDLQGAHAAGGGAGTGGSAGVNS
ncbi:MAG: hypothetical protein VKK62_00780 [Synechococcaceae cyanobacterium]|nr:hypothetical protein [Synechococcaceae cyanobacterium]